MNIRVLINAMIDDLVIFYNRVSSVSSGSIVGLTGIVTIGG